MAIRFHDPRPPTLAATDAYAVGALGDQPLTIGLLANGFPDSMTFLDALAVELAILRPGAAFVRVEKVSPPTPLTEAQHRTLTEGCMGVVAAYGH
jgi:hypothetical protein